MGLFTKRVFFLIALLVLAGSSYGQAKPGEGTAIQRLDVMGQKLTIMRRSLSSAASVLRGENKDDKSKKDDKKNTETPLGRLLGLEKEAGNVQSDVNSLRAKVDRGDKFEISEVNSLEEAVSDLEVRVDKAQIET